jgi:tRNA-specific 2-thiouridylase
MSKKVYVGLSGGVDSSLTTALLKKQGYDVTAVYMKNWTKDIPGFICPWQDDFEDAKRVAVKLDVPIKVYDFEKQYRKKVVDYLVDGYKKGITPNPDIICNQEIKFKLFLETALSDGADLIATGHYARVAYGHLLTAKDNSKDQTYFLYRVNPKALEKTLMPIGDYLKSDVRKIAKEMALPTADKKDSQGICFIGKVGIKEFLTNELGPQPPGNIINEQGKVIGRHDGAIFYTLGQRHGLNVGGGLPYYVYKKDIKTNQVFVTTNLDDTNLWKKELKLSSFHWTYPGFEYKNKQLQAITRYRSKAVDCQLEVNGEEARLTLKDEARAITPGQSTVIYSGDICIGGGIVV